MYGLTLALLERIRPRCYPVVMLHERPVAAVAIFHGIFTSLHFPSSAFSCLFPSIFHSLYFPTPAIMQVIPRIFYFLQKRCIFFAFFHSLQFPLHFQPLSPHRIPKTRPVWPTLWDKIARQTEWVWTGIFHGHSPWGTCYFLFYINVCFIDNFSTVSLVDG